MPPTSFSVRHNPQRTPEGTSPVLTHLRPRWMAFLSILLGRLKGRRPKLSNRRILIPTFEPSFLLQCGFLLRASLSGGLVAELFLNGFQLFLESFHLLSQGLCMTSLGFIFASCF